MQSNFTKIGQQMMHYVKEGSAEKAFVFLHGWGVSHAQYEQLVKDISKCGYTVYAVDLPGFGKSPEPILPWGFEEYTDLIDSFIKTIKVKNYIIAGHSFGGGIALLHASKNPTGLQACVLMGARTLVHPLTMRQKISRSLAQFGKKIFNSSLLKPLEAIAKKSIYKLAGSTDYLDSSDHMKKVMRHIISTDLRRHFSSVNVPTLLLWGREDNATPLSDAYLLQDKIPNTSLVIIDEVNHGFPYKAWDKAKEPLINFLQTHGI